MAPKYKVGDWVKYRETWTKDKAVVMDEIDTVQSTYRLALYGTTRGYIITDVMILEVRRG